MDFLRTLLRLFARELDVDGDGKPDILRAAIQYQMEHRTPRIVAGMEKKGMTVEKAGKRAVIRDALFRLWRQVIPSGDLADFIRDTQDDGVLLIVEPVVDASTPLPEVVRLTMAAALNAMF